MGIFDLREQVPVTPEVHHELLKTWGPLMQSQMARSAFVMPFAVAALQAQRGVDEAGLPVTFVTSLEEAQHVVSGV
ncbi:hypothetical protein AB2L27_10285 [Kineococcus sp. LSe6-4]|uniref:Uncharacterized protein n=1 Tax=Kineococcus halophytocola TaxID=3234027 RepID=A0ABV4H0Q6_9ACTN